MNVSLIQPAFQLQAYLICCMQHIFREIYMTKAQPHKPVQQLLKVIIYSFNADFKVNYVQWTLFTKIAFYCI